MAERRRSGDDGTSAGCPECGSNRAVHDERRAEVVCARCGLVLQAGLGHRGIGLERGGYGEGTERETLRYHDKGLITTLAPVQRDHAGVPLRASSRRRFSRLEALQRRLRYSRPGERSLADGLDLVARVAGGMSLPPSFLEEAAYLYRKAARAGIIRGRTIRGFAVAAVYMATRLQGTPRILEQVAEEAGVPVREATIAFRVMSRQLRIPLPLTRPEDYVDRFIWKLNLPPRFASLTRDILHELRQEEPNSSKTPRGTAAAAIYLAARILAHKVTQVQLSNVARVSEVTLRNRIRDIGVVLGLRLAKDRGWARRAHTCLPGVCLV